MNQDEQLREQLIKGMQSGRAFTSLDQSLDGISLENAGTQAAELPYTLWQLQEHLRIALWDILEFSRGPGYASPKWPEGYWPAEKAPADQKALDQSQKAITAGIAAMVQLVQNEANDLFAPFPHGTGQNLLREAMLVAEHNAYHLGQIVLLRRLLSDWEE